MQEDIINSILAENEKRLHLLRAEYDPKTGAGLSELLDEKRVKLVIEDFAIPVQWVPEEMMRDPLISGIAREKSIEKYIKGRKWKYGEPDKISLERRIRRIRNKHDFCFWAYFNIKITHKKLRKRVRFKLNLPQLVVLKKCEQLRKAGTSIDLIILKARQWGGSTFCFFYQCYLLFMWDSAHSFAIAAHTSSASQTILNMLRRTIWDYPAWELGLGDGEHICLSPTDTTGHSFAIKDVAGNQLLDGQIFIGTAQKPDSLRSKDISGVHYSEVGVWPNTPGMQTEDIIADIQGGLLEGAGTMQVMESTAKSSDDYFHDVWIDCIAGNGGYFPIFIPAYLIVHDSKEIEDKKEFVRWLYENKDNDTPEGKWKDNGKYYWWLWTIGATLEHINWYRFRRLKLSFAKMCNEAPETPEQAFFTAGNHVFDMFQLAQKGMKCRDPLYVGDLVGEGEKGEAAIKDIRFIPNTTGNLRIWEKPDDSQVSNRYVVVLDPRRGASEGADPACITVIDRLLMMSDFGLDGKPGVVAEMNYKADPDLQAYDAMRLAKWYNNALLVIESNTMEAMDAERNNGIDSFEYILDIVSQLYDNLYMRRSGEEDVKEKTGVKYGFHTNSATKPKIINFLKECLRDDLWDEPSKLCIAQMASYMEDHGKTNAEHGKHDDVVMSRAIGLWVCYKEMPVPQWIRHEEKRDRSIIQGDNSGLTNF